MLKTLNAVLKDESGVTMVEYGLIAALISIAAVSLFSGIGTNIKAAFQSISTALTPSS